MCKVLSFVHNKYSLNGSWVFKNLKSGFFFMFPALYQVQESPVGNSPVPSSQRQGTFQVGQQACP